ncbi:proline-, glutamic acid- and leucine-rich protein 1-like [Ischnura elegans]|uniref:proline-, glutamic acid- and leucine-rich protein 1-like n=1 Tax=Ischnura elegans TaxID=197161 RepID=UPI001ED8B968|nr:proline-, glutamic acid- and leucine-rich protein 1-like [Ischnura elegans]
MDNLIDLFHSVSVSPWRDKYLSDFLCGCSEHQAFIGRNPPKLAQVAADINAKLNSATNRTEGLFLLKTFLTQCPDEIFCQNAFSWVSQALISAEGKSNESNTRKISPAMPLTVLRDIIELSGQFPTVVKQLLPVLSKLLRQLTGHQIQDILADFQSSCALLQCLQACMKHYSPQCVPFKGAIEKLLLGIIICSNEAVINEASKCFILLSLINPNMGMKAPQLTGGGNSQCTFLWTQMVSKLVASLHFTLNELYGNVPNFKASALGNDKFELPPVTEENPVLAIQSYATLYINLCEYLSSMLTNPLPAAKSIALEEVLGVVCQALAVTCSSLKNQVSAESLALSICIPQIHIASFTVLNSLMACARLNLLAFGPLIIKLIMQSLRWTQVVKDWPSGVKKPYCSLRCSAYSCLSLWLRISASSSCAEEIAEELISITLCDIVPSREKMTLTTADLRKKGHGKHHKKRKLEVAENNLGEKSSDSTSGYRCAIGDGSTNADICCAALDVLTHLLYSVGPFLKPNQHKILQEKVVSVLVDIQRNSNNLGGKVSGGRCTDLILPYQSNARCRLFLYKLLLALVLEPHSHKWPPPLGIAAQLFANGFNDPNLEVSTFCLTSERMVERILHPSAPTLNFPIMSDKQPDFLNSLISRVKLRESSTHDVSKGGNEVLEGMRNAKLSVQEVQENIDSPDHRCSSSSQSRSPSPEVITLSDEPAILEETAGSPKAVIQDVSTPERPMASNEVVLVRRIERLDRSPAIEKVKLTNVPLTTIQSVGVQVDSYSQPKELPSSSVASHSDKVLVLKLPLQKCDTAESRKDFAQQWTAEKEEMEIVCEETGSEGQVELLGENISTRMNESVESGYVNGFELVLSEDEVKPADGVSEEKDGENSNVGKIKLSEDHSNSIKSKVVNHQILELDVDALSEGEEMISCFVDADPDND